MLAIPQQQASCLSADHPHHQPGNAPHQPECNVNGRLLTICALDRLEKGPRGIYSGCIGYIGFNDCFDLNIVIRSAVLDQQRISIGAGGAIVTMSEPEAEFNEMQLKARTLLQAVGQAILPSGAATELLKWARP